MKEIKFTFYLDGVKTEKDLIDWTRSSTLKCKNNNEIHIQYMDKKGLSTRAKAVDVCPNGILFADSYGNKLVAKGGEISKSDDEDKINISAGSFNLTEEEIWKDVDWNNLQNQIDDYLQKAYVVAEEPVNYYETMYGKRTKTEGQKFNNNKPQLSLLFTQFPQALEAIVKCSEYGHNKYKETDSDYLNFKKVDGGSKTYADAGLRHRLDKGVDSESKLPHQYHVAWNSLAELQLWIEENNK